MVMHACNSPVLENDRCSTVINLLFIPLFLNLLNWRQHRMNTMNAMNIHTGTFSFNDGDKSICSKKCKGDETDAIKTDVLANMLA